MRIPIIFLTAVYSETEYVFKCYQAGAVDYLVKPFNQEILLNKVRAFIQLDQHKGDLAMINEQLKNEIDERKQAKMRIKIQYDVTQVLVESNSLEEAAPGIIRVACLALNWDLGEIWLFDQQAGVLRNADIWHKSSITANEFKAATKTITFPAKTGLPGRVMESAIPL